MVARARRSRANTPHSPHLRFGNGWATMGERGGFLVDPRRNRTYAAGAPVTHRPHLPVELYGKVEACNPGGSAKDRLALHLCDMAERRGLLRPGGTIVEASAGNTGVGLSMVAAVRGYHSIVVVPNGTSPDKLAVVRALGAEIRECAPDEDYVEVAEAMARERRAFRPDQFHNPDNPESHSLTTAREISADLDGRVDVLVAACGTGGTLAGVGRALREANPELRLVRVSPSGTTAASRSSRASRPKVRRRRSCVPSSPPRSRSRTAPRARRCSGWRAKRESSSGARRGRRSPAPCSKRPSCRRARA